SARKCGRACRRPSRTGPREAGRHRAGRRSPVNYSQRRWRQSRAEALQAIARLEAAEESLRRFTNMFAKGIATQLEVFEAETRAREARIDVERTRGANSLLGEGNGVQFFVTAPTNGVVLSISA